LTKTSRRFWIIAALVAATWVALSSLSAYGAIRAGQWAKAPGSILSAEYKLGCGRGGNQPYPDVRYRYWYEGKVYTGFRVAVDTDHCGWARPAAEVASRYKPGQNVTVYVDQAKPSRSALVAGTIQDGTAFALGASAFSLVVCCAVLVRGKHRAA
jgi:hypothetical protein